MLRVRLFLACLLMLALPLQGMASVAMQTCAPAAHASVAAPGPAGMAGMHAHHGHDARSHTGASVAPQPDAGGSASLHHCSFCAASCHSVAPGLAAQPFDLRAPLLAMGPRTSQRVKDIFPALPDKPPRA